MPSIFSEGRAAAETEGDRVQLCILLSNYAAIRGLSGDLENYLRIGTVLADTQIASGNAGAAAITAAEAVGVGVRQRARLYEATAQVTLARALRLSKGIAAQARNFRRVVQSLRPPRGCSTLAFNSPQNRVTSSFIS